MPPLFRKGSAKVRETISLATLPDDELIKLVDTGIEEMTRRANAGHKKFAETVHRYGAITDAAANEMQKQYEESNKKTASHKAALEALEVASKAERIAEIQGVNVEAARAARMDAMKAARDLGVNGEARHLAWSRGQYAAEEER